MDDIVRYLFALCGVVAIVSLKYLDSRCAHCKESDAMVRVIGIYTTIILLGPDKFKGTLKYIVENRPSFTISRKKDDS